MLPAIQLNNKATFQTHKIHDVFANRVLAPEFQGADLTTVEFLPKFLFGVGQILA
jgi:hypothetical protein